MRGRSGLMLAVLLVASLASAGVVAAGPTTTTSPTTTTTASAPDDGPSKADVFEIVEQGSDVTRAQAETVYEWVRSNDLSNLSTERSKQLYRWVLQRAAEERVPSDVVTQTTAQLDAQTAEQIARDVTETLPVKTANRVLAAAEESGASWTASVKDSIQSVSETDDESSSQSAASPTATSGEWTYEGLARAGKRYEDAPSSMRWLGRYGSITVRHTPVGIASGWKYLKPGTTIHSNQLTLRSVRLAPEDELDATMNVTVVTWQKGQESVQRGNATATRPVAKNVSAVTKQVELGRGYDTANVSLPQNYGEAVQVTMLLEGYDGARWRFAHKSVKSSQSVPFAPTWAGFWKYVSGTLLLPILVLVGGVAMAVPASIRRTGRGPNMGLLFWFIVLSIGVGLVAGGAYVWTTSLLASAPWVVAFLIAAVIGIMMLETMESGVDRVAFVRLFTEEKTNPRGDLAAKANGGEFEIATIANTGDGDVLAITDGIRPWLARLWGGGAKLLGQEKLQNEFTLSSPELSLTRSPASKMVFVDEDVEQIIDYEPEELEFDLPITDHDDNLDWAGLTSIGFYSVLGGVVGYLGFGAIGMASPATGIVSALLTVGVVFTHVSPGRAAFVPAVGNTQDAVATAMYYESEVDNYETLEDAITALIDERNTDDELVSKLEELDEENLIRSSAERDNAPSGYVTGGQSAAEGD
ncbi:hypothetical protein [Halarchaeum sp. P4]|uniref:hypothetical protein n=1 Tax=Halarchaeum sp. P4 TaxID=3421639 RepID=UPI003EBED0EA